MSKKVYLIAFTSIMFVLAGFGCSNNDNNLNHDPGSEPISGTVYSIENGRILVIKNIDDVNIPRSEWFEQGKRAVYFAVEGNTTAELDGEQVDTDLITRGQEVDVYHEGFLAESYPEQGKALKVVITDPEAAEETYTDSGKFVGIMVKESVELLEVKISSLPEEMESRFFRMTGQARIIVDELELEPDEEIIFRYLEDDKSEGLIFDLAKL